MKIKAIYFDMDGTIADLYSVSGWLEMLENEDVTPYQIAKPIGDIETINTLISLVSSKGIHVGIISWSSKHGSSAYKDAITNAKNEWVSKYLPAINDICVTSYGLKKTNARDTRYSILFDDNEDVRDSWYGEGRKAYPPEEIINVLTDILCSI